MPLDLIEGGVNAIKNYLGSNLASKITALNTAYSDSITLDSIPSTRVYDAEQIEQDASSFPFVEVIGIRTDVITESKPMMQTSHHFAIMVTDEYSDRSVLRRRVMRYCRGIIELLKAAREDSTFSGYAVVLRGGAIDFLPLRRSRRSQSRVIGTAVIGCSLTTTEAV